MIKSIAGRNFRSHKETFIELHPGVNVFMGDNDAGKTNILRLINWIVNNRPAGDDVRSNWGGDTSGHLDIGGKIVGRHKSKSENLYTLTHADGDVDEFRAFGQGVPEAISQHLNLSAVNIHSQLEGPFLLNLSPAEVARHYNNLVNLDIIDRTISNIGKALRTERNAKLNLVSNISNLEGEIESYNWLPKAEGCLSKLEVVKGEIARLYRSHSKLETLSVQLNGLLIKSKQIQEITKHEDLAADLTTLDKEAQALAHRKNYLATRIFEHKKLKKAEKQAGEVLKFEREVAGLLEIDDLITKGIDRYNLLGELSEKAHRLTEKHEGLTDELLDLEAEFDKLMPDECPLCGRGCDCDKV